MHICTLHLWTIKQKLSHIRILADTMGKAIFSDLRAFCECFWFLIPHQWILSIYRASSQQPPAHITGGFLVLLDTPLTLWDIGPIWPLLTCPANSLFQDVRATDYSGTKTLTWEICFWISLILYMQGREKDYLYPCPQPAWNWMHLASMLGAAGASPWQLSKLPSYAQGTLPQPFSSELPHPAFVSLKLLTWPTPSHHALLFLRLPIPFTLLLSIPSTPSPPNASKV